MKPLHLLAYQYARSGFRGSEILWEFIIRLSAWPENYSRVTLPDGFSFYFNKNDWTSCSIYKGQYELEIQKVIELLEYEDRDILIDIGANLGRIGFLLAKKSNIDSTLYAFEAVKSISRQLEGNLSKLQRKVIIYNVALGDKEETKSILKPNLDFNSGLSTLRKLSNEVFLESELVEVKTLDSFFSEENERIAVLKIDVEGWEPQVLEGAKELMKRMPPKYVILEYTPMWYEDKYSLFEHLTRYRMYNISVLGKVRKRLTLREIKDHELNQVTQQILILCVLKQ